MCALLGLALFVANLLFHFLVVEWMQICAETVFLIAGSVSMVGSDTELDALRLLVSTGNLVLNSHFTRAG